MDNLFQFFNREFPFNKEGLELFVNSFETRSHKKGNRVLSSSNKDTYLRFLDEGVIREYYAIEEKEKLAV